MQTSSPRHIKPEQTTVNAQSELQAGAVCLSTIIAFHVLIWSLVARAGPAPTTTEQILLL